MCNVLCIVAEEGSDSKRPAEQKLCAMCCVQLRDENVTVNSPLQRIHVQCVVYGCGRRIGPQMVFRTNFMYNMLR